LLISSNEQGGATDGNPASQGERRAAAAADAAAAAGVTAQVPAWPLDCEFQHSCRSSSTEDARSVPFSALALKAKKIAPIRKTTWLTY